MWLMCIENCSGPCCLSRLSLISHGVAALCLGPWPLSVRPARGTILSLMEQVVLDKDTPGCEGIPAMTRAVMLWLSHLVLPHTTTLSLMFVEQYVMSQPNKDDCPFRNPLV